MTEQEIENELRYIKNRNLIAMVYKYQGKRYELHEAWGLDELDDDGQAVPNNVPIFFDKLEEFLDSRMFDGKTFEEAFRSGEIIVETSTIDPYEFDLIP